MAHLKDLTPRMLEGLKAGAANALSDSMDIYPETLHALVVGCEQRVELVKALEKTLTACENMTALPLPEDWREKLLEEYPGALAALKEEPSQEVENVEGAVV
jgi:hypothetical protein